MKDIIGKFVGSKKIQYVKLAERKTYLGKDVYEITFESGITAVQEITEENLKNILSDVATDETQVRDKMVDSLVEKTMGILLEGEIKVIDMEYFKQKLTGTINYHHENSETILWGKEYYDKTLADINAIITKSKQHGRNNKSTKTEGTGNPPSAGGSDGQKGKGAIRPE